VCWHLRIVFLVYSQNCFVTTYEIVDPVGALLKLLERICRNILRRVLVLVYVIDLYLVFVAWDVGHQEILLDCRRKHRVPAIVNMFTNDINSARSSAEESGLSAIELLESLSEVPESRYVLSLDVSVGVVICLVELSQHRHECAIV